MATRELTTEQETLFRSYMTWGEEPHVVWSYPDNSNFDRHQQLVMKYTRSLPGTQVFQPQQKELLEFSYWLNERLYFDFEDEEEGIEAWYFSLNGSSDIDYLLQLWKEGLE